MTRIFTIVLAALAIAAVSGQGGRSTPAAPPRIAPLPEQAWTETHRALVSAFSPGSAPTNDLRTFLVHPDLVKGVMPFIRYVTADSTLAPRHRELLILRTAWLTRSEYVWARHAPRAAAAGLSGEEVMRVAHGPQAQGWTPFEASLLRAADELHRDAFVHDDTWAALAAQYGTHQLMDAVFTVAELTMLAATYNSVRVPIDEGLTARLPAAPRVARAPPPHIPLAAPRVPPLEPPDWTPAVRALLDPGSAGREVAAVYRTFARHPTLYVPRQTLSEYIRLHATLTPRVREILILRIGYLCDSEYEWAAHARAGRRAGLTDQEIERLARRGYAGWSASDSALLRAVDELHAEDVLSDPTWSRLASELDERQMLDLLITTGGYRMVSMALNTFGVPLEPGSERFPATRDR